MNPFRLMMPYGQVNTSSADGLSGIYGTYRMMQPFNSGFYQWDWLFYGYHIIISILFLLILILIAVYIWKKIHFLDEVKTEKETVKRKTK